MGPDAGGIQYRKSCFGGLRRAGEANVVGGAFSGKHDPFDVDFAAVRLAQITNRPVKIALNYDEVLAAYRQRNAMNATLKMGVKKNGKIMALRAECVLEGGPIAGIGPFNIYFFGAWLNLPYKVPAIEYHGTLVYSNRAPCGTVRGQEIVLSQYALDSLVGIVAEDLGIDQVEIRAINAGRATGPLQTAPWSTIGPARVHRQIGPKDRLEKKQKIPAGRQGHRL